MTREQLIADVAAVLKEEEVAGYETQARRVIYMVLEAAAKECEHKGEEVLRALGVVGNVIRTTWMEAAQALRAMKGTP